MREGESRMESTLRKESKNKKNSSTNKRMDDLQSNRKRDYSSCCGQESFLSKTTIDMWEDAKPGQVRQRKESSGSNWITRGRWGRRRGQKTGDGYGEVMSERSSHNKDKGIISYQRINRF